MKKTMRNEEIDEKLLKMCKNVPIYLSFYLFKTISIFII